MKCICSDAGRLRNATAEEFQEFIGNLSPERMLSFRSGIGTNDVRDLNMFIEGLNTFIQSGMTLRDLNYDFDVKSSRVLVLFRVELFRPDIPQLRQIKPPQERASGST